MPNKDRVMKQWDDASESWVDFVRQGKDFCRDEMNNPATFRLIGNVNGQRVLDLACGEGYNTRILARKGAKVTGVDFSRKLIELARIEETREKLGIDYRTSDVADLSEFPSSHFDVVTCFMALMDIKNYCATMSEVSRVLKNMGRFVFSIPHPCFELERIGTTKNYFVPTEETVDWKMERLLKPFKTTSFHRTMTDYFNILQKSRLLVKRLVEPRPVKQVADKYPLLKQFLLRPHTVIIESIKIASNQLEGSC
jgi:2-polyprenyl-3-methyl-5-hydroxy-6-metoxy-1,4-benzoquinol methylase